MAKIDSKYQGIPSICLYNFSLENLDTILATLTYILHLVKNLHEHLILWYCLYLVHLLVSLYLVANVLEQELVLETLEDLHEVGDVPLRDALHYLSRVERLYKLLIRLL